MINYGIEVLWINIKFYNFINVPIFMNGSLVIKFLVSLYQICKSLEKDIQIVVIGCTKAI